MENKYMIFLEWLLRFDAASVARYVQGKRCELIAGRLGVTLDAAHLSLLQEAMDSGLLPQNGSNSELKGAEKTGPSSDQ